MPLVKVNGCATFATIPLGYATTSCTGLASVAVVRGERPDPSVRGISTMENPRGEVPMDTWLDSERLESRNPERPYVVFLQPTPLLTREV